MVYVMSDIHSQEDLLYKMLDKINLSDEDTLVIAGDVIDRANKSKGQNGVKLLQEVLEMPNVIMLCGNHEQMLLDRIGYSYGDDTQIMQEFLELPLDEQEQLEEDIRRLPLFYVYNKYIICHGGIDATISGFVPKGDLDAFLDGQDDEFVLWARNAYSLYPALKGFTVVSGHTPVPFLYEQHEELGIDNPFKIWFDKQYKDKIIVDCGATFYGVLGCLCLDTMEEFYVYNDECKIPEKYRE